MRAPLSPYRGTNKVNYLCVLASELMGVNSLKDIPHLLGGFHSVGRTLDPKVAQAIQTLRLGGFAPVTHREMRLVVDAYLNHYSNHDAGKEWDEEQDGIAQRYEIDQHFNIKRRWSTATPADVSEAIACMIHTPAVRERVLADAHDPNLSATIRRRSDDYRGDVEPLGFLPPAIPEFSLDHVGQPPGLITWEELIASADRFDEMDVEAGRQVAGQRNWYHRLYDANGEPTANLMEASAGGLVPSKGLDLCGIKHLIGLPGAGKTTLLFLLADCLSKKGYRVCFLFPSIEVSTAFIETLEHYDVPVGLLSGQSESARARHITNFSASVGRVNNGYGVTRSTARFFATNCALAGFASEEEEALPCARAALQCERQVYGVATGKLHVCYGPSDSLAAELQ